jgi:hypothetical protein
MKMASADTVTVACKIPNGLLLQLEERVKSLEPSPSGGREVEVGRKVGEPVKINGCAIPMTGQPPAHQITGGYGLTVVKKDFWDAWFKQNKDLDMVREGLLFAHEKRETVEAKARDQKTVRSNMEPLDPDGKKADGTFKDPRMLKGIKKADDKDMDAA